MKVFAKTLNPEFFDYRIYDYVLDENSDLIIEGGRDFTDINFDQVKAIKKVYDEYNCYDYEVYYQSSIKAYLEDLLPKKENGKAFSPKEIHTLKIILDKGYSKEEEKAFVLEVLKIIKGKEYSTFTLRGCCQGEVVKLYAPTSTSQYVIDWVEAWYFGTGIEVEVNEELSLIETDIKPEEIVGFTFYTPSWKTEDIKREVKEQLGVKDDVEVVLYEWTGYRTIHIDEYKRAGE